MICGVGWKAMIAATIWVGLIVSGCTSDLAQCGDDGDCPGLQRCVPSGGLLLRTTVCVGDWAAESDGGQQWDIGHETDGPALDTGPVGPVDGGIVPADTGLDGSNPADTGLDGSNGPDAAVECTHLSPPLPGDGCDPLCQTGCAPGENCIARPPAAIPFPYSQCMEATTREQGASCGGEIGCQVGFICVVLSDRPSRCYQTCRVDGTEEPLCPEGYRCLRYIEDETRVGLCEGCTYYPNDSCPNGQSCYQTTTGRSCLDYNSDATMGSPCQRATECNEAQACALEVGNEFGECRPVCIDADDCGGQGQICGSLWTRNEDGQVIELPYGVCRSS